MNTEAHHPRLAARYGHILFIIVIGIIIRIPLLTAPLTSGFSDSWRQADTASIAHHFYINGYRIFYPQIYWGGSGPGYVETEFQLFTFITALLYRILGEQVWLGRLVSLSFTVVTFIAFYLLARRLMGPRAAPWALVFLVVSPLLIRYSVEYMPEATVLCFYTVALYLFQRWLDEDNPRILLLAAVSTALAILVKPTAIHIGLIFLLLLIEKYRWRFLKMKYVWLFGVISLLPGALWYLHARNLFLTYGNTFGVFSGGDSKFGNLSYWLSVSFYRSLIQLDTEWIFAGVGILVFLLGIVLWIRQRYPRILLYGVATIVIYYMIVARYAGASWGIQYHIYMVPFAALGVGMGLAAFFTPLEALKRYANLAAYAPMLIGLVALAFVLYSSARISRKLPAPSGQDLAMCGVEVAKVVPPNEKIIVSTTSSADDHGIPNNYQEPQIFFYSDRYGWSLPGDWHTPEYVEQYHRDGASFLVIYSADLYNKNQPFADYLRENARQIGPGVDKGCGIYQLRQQN